jgi:hypothetical protein
MWVDIEQNTDEWLALRAGKVGGSSIGKIMANYGKAFGDPAKKLAVQLAIEQITGQPILSTFTNDHMARGHEQEPIARALYEDRYFCDVTKGGMYDNGKTGISPDGLVRDDGIIEIKSVIASVQFATQKRNNIDPSYKWQCAFNLKESGRDWLDYVSFCADYPEGKRLFVHRITVDEMEEQFGMIDKRLDEFWLLLSETKKIIESA